MGHLPIFDAGSESFFHSDVMGHYLKSNYSFHSVPGLLVGLIPKGLTDSDYIRSPKSPLEFRVFSNIGQSFKSPRSSQDGQQRGWDNSKVGLSIIDSLDHDKKVSVKVFRSSESKNILFGPQLRKKPPNGVSGNNSFELPKSLPKDHAIFPHSKTKSPLQKGSSDVLFEIVENSFEAEPYATIRSSSFDSGRAFSGLIKLNPNFNSRNSQLENVSTRVCSSLNFFGGSQNSNQFSDSKLRRDHGSQDVTHESLSASEIELSEDYTCVISHGPNPKTTLIYGDCILEAHSNDLSSSNKKVYKESGVPLPITDSDISVGYPSCDFLSVCYSCKKKLEEGKDIYMYRFAACKSIWHVIFYLFSFVSEMRTNILHWWGSNPRHFSSLKQMYRFVLQSFLAD